MQVQYADKRTVTAARTMHNHKKNDEGRNSAVDNIKSLVLFFAGILAAYGEERMVTATSTKNVPT